jgi:hypothetical protein
MTFARDKFRTEVERTAFDLGVAHYETHRSTPKDLGSVAGALDLARTAPRRDRVFRAIRAGIVNAHLATVA